MKFPQTLPAAHRSFRPDPSSPKASVHLRNSHTVSGLPTSPRRRPGLRSIANSRKICPTHHYARPGRLPFTCGTRTYSAWRARLDFARNPSAHAETNKVATSGCSAAHADVAARTAGTNASGKHVTPSEGAASARRGTGIQIARAIHSRELASAQENHVWRQPSALVDPAPDLKWIHGTQRLRCFGIGYSATVGTGIPGGVKSEPGAGGHTDLVMGNRTENDGAGRGTKAVDDHHFARAAHALIFIDVGLDPAAAVFHNPNHRIACFNPREQESRRQ